MLLGLTGGVVVVVVYRRGAGAALVVGGKMVTDEPAGSMLTDALGDMPPRRMDLTISVNYCSRGSGRNPKATEFFDSHAVVSMPWTSSHAGGRAVSGRESDKAACQPLEPCWGSVLGQVRGLLPSQGGWR